MTNPQEEKLNPYQPPSTSPELKKLEHPRGDLMIWYYWNSFLSCFALTCTLVASILFDSSITDPENEYTSYTLFLIGIPLAAVSLLMIIPESLLLARAFVLRHPSVKHRIAALGITMFAIAATAFVAMTAN